MVYLVVKITLWLDSVSLLQEQIVYCWTHSTDSTEWGFTADAVSILALCGCKNKKKTQFKTALHGSL